MKKTIIYVMSDVRSGSTLLENILSNAPNTLSVGELHHLDSHLYKGKWGRPWNWTCSCGKSIDNCKFWNKTNSIFNFFSLLTPSFLVRAIVPLYIAWFIFMIRFYLMPILLGYGEMGMLSFPLDSEISRLLYNLFGK